MVPGEENQLVPKEVRGQRRRLGPRPAAAGGSAGPASVQGPARVRARVWGQEEGWGGGGEAGEGGGPGRGGEQLGDPTGSQGPRK